LEIRTIFLVLVGAISSQLTRHYGKRTRKHDGKIITLYFDSAGAPKLFSIQCWKAERVHVAFSLDTCDREVISFIASTIGVNGQMIHDLMFESIESRFNEQNRAPKWVQWLTDNGSAYVANDTVALARQLNLEPCISVQLALI
jgi:putative transposase